MVCVYNICIYTYRIYIYTRAHTHTHIHQGIICIATIVAGKDASSLYFHVKDMKNEIHVKEITIIVV